MSYANDMTPTVQSASRTDTGLASELRLSVMRLARRLRNERQPDNPLSVAAVSALGVLFREGECTVGALAAHERVQPPSMTRTVNCLVEEGYAVRRPHETDGRQVLVDITDKGRETSSPTGVVATPGSPSDCATSPPTNAPSCARSPPCSRDWPPPA